LLLLLFLYYVIRIDVFQRRQMMMVRSFSHNNLNYRLLRSTIDGRI